MILKLRNEKIIIEGTRIPALCVGVPISFDYELGTNHYKTVLTVSDKKYIGVYHVIPLDLLEDEVTFKVELLDTHDTIMRTYTGTFTYIKMCMVGDKKLIDMYEELQKLYKENQELKEKGELI